MLYLPFARDKRLWLPSPFLRGGANVPLATVLASSSSAAAGTTQTTGGISASVAPGEQVFGIMSFISGSGAETVTFSDTGGNTWTSGAPSYSGLSKPAVCICRMNCTVGLTSGVSTFSGAASASVSARQICIFKVTGGGLLVPITLDQAQTINSTAAGTALTPGSQTPVADQVFGVFALCKSVTGGTTPAANWTEIFDFANSTVMATEVEYTTALLAKGAATNPSASWATSGIAVAAMALFRTTQPVRQVAMAASLQAAQGRAGSW